MASAVVTSLGTSAAGSSCAVAATMAASGGGFRAQGLPSRPFGVGHALVLPLVLAVFLAAPGGGASAEVPADFIDDVRSLYRVVTCQPDALEKVAPRDRAELEAAVAGYCKRQQPRFQRFKAHWGTTAHAFILALEPKGLPREAVYPFGGGDLMSALNVFPEAEVITTLSLELAGDPRRLAGLLAGGPGKAKALASSLSAIAQASTSTLVSNDSLSKNLSRTQRGELPGQLSMHLMGLALWDYEPVSVRYFRVEPDGALHYYTRAEVETLEQQTASKLHATWKAPDFSPAFANVEVQFVPKGSAPGAVTAPRRVFRHIGADLSNEGLSKLAPGVLKHLEAKVRVAAMTKAASYLLWNAGFSTLRDYLVAHADWMVSDSTGVPPRWWKKAGCSVQTYGAFEKSFLGAWEGYQEELREAFSKAKALPMRFGYPDGSPDKLSHMFTADCMARGGADAP
jgi:hypothetical protein